MNTSQKIFFTLLLILFSGSLFSSPEIAARKKGTLSGVVFDKLSNTPIEYANISLFSAADSLLIDGGITDVNGGYSLSDVPYGSYYLFANYIGYKKSVINEIEISKETKNIELESIFLVATSEQLESVEITAEKNSVEYKIDKKVINVSQNINAAGGSAAEVLENVPSVNVDIEGNVTLRGSGEFTVLVDGRPSPLSSNDILKQIPASAIENIEIITNPSAKYDPDGTAGIINIIMKKNQADGMNGIISLNGDSNSSFGGTANLNARKNKVNYFTNISFNNRTNIMESVNDRKTFFTDTTRFLTERTDRNQTTRPWRINSGLDYYISDKNFLTFSATVGGFGYYREFETNYETYTSPETSRNYSYSKNNFDVDGIYYAGSLTFEHKFDKEDTKLTFESTAWQWNGKNVQLSHQYDTDSNWDFLSNETNVRTTTRPTRNNIRAKLDFSTNIFEGKFETGLLTMVTGGGSNYAYSDYNYTTDNWDEDLNKASDLDYYRAIYSAYASYNNKTKWFDYQLGIRLENTDRVITQKTTIDKYKLNLLNYYPTVHLSKQLSKLQQVQLSYSKRIQRPRTFELYPYSDYADKYNVSYGNPMLEPEDIHSYEMNYIITPKSMMISTGVYYRQTDNTKIMSQHINAANPDLMIVSYSNLDKTEALGVELNVNYYITKWATANVGGNFYSYKVSDAISANSNLTNSNKWDSRLNLTFNVKKQIRLQFLYIYQGPGVNGQGYQYETHMVNAAARYDFWKNKATLSFNVQDIFATSKYESLVENDQFYSYFKMKPKSSIFRLSFSYRINNYKRRARDSNEYR